MAEADSLCSQVETLHLTSRDTGDFYQKLQDFPHTFQLEKQERLDAKKLKRLQTGLEWALKVGHETILETARATNLLAYLHHRQRRSEEALQLLDKVLDMQGQGNNLVTLANKAVILWSRQQPTKADQYVKTLVKLRENDQDFHDLVVKAQAELAFSYTRFGPSFSSQAIGLFEKVIPKAKEQEKWLWMFGLNLTRRRRLRTLPQATSTMPSPEMLSEEQNLFKSFLEIIQNCASSKLQAKCYAEVAVLLDMIKPKNIRSDLVQKTGLNREKACEKALALDKDDNSVLCKCGRIFRYCRRTQEAKQLLEKAVSIRPSSNGHHHLALVYKILAKVEKYKYTQTEQGQYFPRKSSHDATTYSRAKNPQVQVSPGGAPSLSFHNTYSPNYDVRSMQKPIKSPPKDVTRFQRDDRYIEEVLHHLRKAVDFSEGENVRALYDLVLMLKSFGELKQAKEYLRMALSHDNLENVGVSDEISIYEQLGLINGEQAENETDTTLKEELLDDRKTCLQNALRAASKNMSKTKHIGEIWQSFSELWKEAENSSSSDYKKRQEKAKLLQLIGQNKQSIEVLQVTKAMDAEEAKDPQNLKLCIEGFAKMGKYEEALTFVELLGCTSQHSQVLEMFKDSQYVLKIYMLAAREALLKGSSEAKRHFLHVFKEAVLDNCDTSSGASKDSKSGVVWDAIIVHEDEEQPYNNAIALAKCLEEVCGLKVTVKDRHVQLGTLERDGIVSMMSLSAMVIVLIGTEKPSEEFRFYIDHAAPCLSTVTLLFENGNPPKMLTKRRSMICPAELLEGDDLLESEAGRVCRMEAVCKLFSFLVNVDVDFQAEDSKRAEKAEVKGNEAARKQDDEQEQSNHIIMYNVEESSNTTAAEEEKHDRELLMNILSIIYPYTGGHFPCERLGQRPTETTSTGNDKPRPLKVVLPNPNLKWRLIGNSSRLKMDPQFKDVSIAIEMTPQQREEQKILEAEVKARNERGENVVIYNRRIITMNERDALQWK